MQLSRGRRRGVNFTIRVSEEERRQLEELKDPNVGLGPWLVHHALNDARRAREAVPPPAALPARAIGERLILDLCGGTGAWSAPYFYAGYEVLTITLPHFGDVRTFTIDRPVHGILAAPPCTQFSMARNGHPRLERDLVEGMACVNACMRIVLQCRPKWWALENPAGLLGRFLGSPRDTFEPHHFGDAWTKRTCLWGDFAIPARGPFVKPTSSAMRRSTAAERAITPPGFARAFFEANP